jgi:hypothetical protein
MGPTGVGIQTFSGSVSVIANTFTNAHIIANNTRGWIVFTANTPSPCMLMGFFEYSPGVTFPSLNQLATSGSSAAAIGSTGAVPLEMIIDQGTTTIQVKSTSDAVINYKVNLMN